MKVTRAATLGACSGVQKAIDLALGSDHKHDLTILGDLVHNPQTVQRLRAAGIRMVSSPDEPVGTRHVMITAHGAAAKVKAAVAAQGLVVEDATCPLVTRVHKTVKAFAAAGFFPVVIGKAEHVEVKGIVGDLEEYAVIRSLAEVGKVRDIPRLGIVSQTTNRVEEVERIVAAIKAQGHEEVKYADTICQPVKDRQQAAAALAETVAVMIVVGGRDSSNTKKLKELCAERGARAHQVESQDDINPGWFKPGDHVGVTAGTSTPPEVIDAVCEYLEGLG